MDDDTQLSTLVKEGDELVAEILGLDRTPMKIQILRAFTLEEFLDRSCGNDISRRLLLEEWARRFKLLDVFKKEDRPVKKSKIELSLQSLESLQNLRPPMLDLEKSPREFVAQESWKVRIESTILEKLSMKDCRDGSARVEPMSFSRCSRGGKTRSLYEIANWGLKLCGEEVPVILVSFGDFSSYYEDEEPDELEALLTRIAFAAWKKRNQSLHDGGYTQELWEEFLKLNYTISEETIKEWLGSGPALLLIDEMNKLTNLNKETDEARKNSEKFGKFLKNNFCQSKGRYFIFLTHIISFIECLGDFLCPKDASERHVIMEELPLVTTLDEAKKLKDDISGSREAVFYGLMPGLLWVRKTIPLEMCMPKRSEALRSFQRSTSVDERKEWFIKILGSMITGEPKHVHDTLHVLLDVEGFGCIRWAPFHFQYVVTHMGLKDKQLEDFAQEMKLLCLQIHGAKHYSGDGWESLFVLFLLVRCITERWDGPLLPSDRSKIFQSEKSPVLYYNRPLKQNCLDGCKTWKDLESSFVLGSEPELSIFYPTHASFEVYDVILVFSENKGIKYTIGYQLKEGSSNSKQPMNRGFNKSFVLRGDPPKTAGKQQSGWDVVDEKTIDQFFGVSGKYWTPKHWKLLVTGEGGC